jgi:formate-dependent nitrite reductase membrane component NrfD
MKAFFEYAGIVLASASLVGVALGYIVKLVVEHPHVTETKFVARKTA